KRYFTTSSFCTSRPRDLSRPVTLTFVPSSFFASAASASWVNTRRKSITPVLRYTPFDGGAPHQSHSSTPVNSPVRRCSKNRAQSSQALAGVAARPDRPRPARAAATNSFLTISDLRCLCRGGASTHPGGQPLPCRRLLPVPSSAGEYREIG